MLTQVPSYLYFEYIFQPKSWGGDITINMYVTKAYHLESDQSDTRYLGYTCCIKR